MGIDTALMIGKFAGILLPILVIFFIQLIIWFVKRRK